MLESLGDRRRMEMKEAPSGLIEPIRKLVKTSLLMCAKGEMDSLNRQSVYLFDPEDGVYFQLSNLRPEGTKRWPIEELGSGLFLTEYRFDEKRGEMLENIPIQMPAHPDAVNKEEIFILRALTPESVMKVEKSLRRSKVVQIIDAVAHDVEETRLLNA